MDLEHRRIRQGRKRQRLREMRISNGEEMEPLKDSLNESPCLKNHIAICQEESVSFNVLPDLMLNGKKRINTPLSPDVMEKPNCEEGKAKDEQDPDTQRDAGAGLRRQQDLRPRAELNRQFSLPFSGWDAERDAQLRLRASQSELSAGRGSAESLTLYHAGEDGGPAKGTAALSGRQVVGKADSWPHRSLATERNFTATSKSDFSLNTLLAEAERGESSGLQRRTSQGSDQEKTTRRKVRVYSTDSPSDESFSSGSLDCESMFSGTLFDNDLKDNDFLSNSFSLEDDTGPLDDSASDELPSESLPGLEPDPEIKCRLPATGSLSRTPCIAGCMEQEKRRFSASELINRLHLSQKKVAQALKLSKSLSGRSTPREKTPTFSFEGRRSAKQKSKSLISINSNVSSRPQRDGLIFDSPPPSLWKSSTVPRRVGSEGELNAKQLNERRHSRFLLNSILYQEYSNVASDREIQRQKRADTVIEEDDAILVSKYRSLPQNSAWSQRSVRGNAFALWQDIPDVRRSGLLDRMCNEQRKLQEAKFELVTSEGSYLRSLTITIEHFQNSRELQECLNTQEKQWLFSKLPEVKEVSEKFLQELEERLEKDILNFDVCDIVLAHCPAFRRVYLPYVTNQAYQEKTYQRLLLENPRFSSILAKMEEDQVCQRLPLTSFLILPFQRIMRLKMLVENILKRTEQGSQEEETATKAFDKLKKLTQECNSSVQSMKRTEELIHLNNKIHFESKIFPLISQSRWLVKHGELTEVDSQVNITAGSKFKLSTRPIYLHLFNDCLLLSRKKDTGKFAVFVHAKTHQLRAKDLNMKVHGIPGHVFHLQLLEKHRVKQQILLRARTESEKQRWITAMLLADKEIDTDYIEPEKDDIPQVQCVKTYKPQEADELALEKADVLEVKTRTKDGWIEGIRLSDGERGWFPNSHVEEITNRNARLRNLWEKNRIKHATRKLHEECQ
ncbi:rho guanine nucleotide exchange factor 19 isoform X1 [Carcharodon carcharias]|uniref:rho guanine nucleotide exchange factor 19 isoform X1 n=1 Tax=Carcharodon carcharias TaxID=13397 RepID=UPI001B7F0F6F|nr:rho guanine nucleotide exchange factor 19 isoform X1 [Carcharodon carcharias]